MDLPLVLALAAKANAFFRDEPGRMEVLAGDLAFAKVNDLSFVRQNGLGSEVVAEGSLPWFRRLRKEGVAQVRPSLTGMAHDKADDASWGLLTDGDRGIELWSPTLTTRFKGRDDLQPYRLTLGATRFDRRSVPAMRTVAEAGEDLAAALRGLQEDLQRTGQAALAGVVGKFYTLHMAESPEIVGDLSALASDLLPCSAPLFASASRVLGLLQKTGWEANPEGSPALAEPLSRAARGALEASV